MKALILIGSFATQALSSMAAQSQTLIECEAGKGWAYYSNIEPETGKPTGWVEDGITGGSITLVRDGDEFDLLIRDTIGTISARAEGAQIVLLGFRATYLEVLASYPQGAKEIYTFDFAAKQLVWSQHKFGVLYDKAHTFVAACR